MPTGGVPCCRCPARESTRWSSTPRAPTSSAGVRPASPCGVRTARPRSTRARRCCATAKAPRRESYAPSRCMGSSARRGGRRHGATPRSTPTGSRRQGLQGEDLLPTAVFSPDGRYLAAADTQRRLTLWDAGGQHRIAVLAVADSTVERPALAFSAGGSLLAASRDDGSVRVWETASLRLAGATLPTGEEPVLAIGFTPGVGELHSATAHLPLCSAQLTPDRAAADVCARAGGRGDPGRVARVSARRALPADVLREVGGAGLDFEGTSSDVLPLVVAHTRGYP